MPVCGGKAPFYTLLSVCSRHTTRHLFSSPEVPGTTLFHYVVPLGVIHPCHLRVLRRISGQGSLGSGGNLADKMPMLPGTGLAVGFSDSGRGLGRAVCFARRAHSKSARSEAMRRTRRRQATGRASMLASPCCSTQGSDAL